jgi:hypothetical protein
MASKMAEATLHAVEAISQVASVIETAQQLASFLEHEAIPA